MKKKTITHKDFWGETRTYEIVNEFPYCYEVWNIGRENFPFPKFIPLAMGGYNGNPFHIYPDKLKALEVESEEFALFLLSKVHQKIVYKDIFDQLHEQFFKK